MDLALTDAEAAFRDELRMWLADNLPAAWRYAGGFETERLWQRRLHDGGWIGVHWPREHGGRGASPIEYVIYTQELALARAPEIANRVGVNLAGPTLIAHGTPEQRARHLPGIMSAGEIWCQLYSEPAAGSDLASLTTRAERDGDGYVLYGQKVWSSYAREAACGLALVRTDTEAPAHRGISCVIVPMDADGVEIRPLRQMTGAVEFYEVFLDGVRVPASNLVGREHEGWRVAMTTLGHERGVGFAVKEWAVQRVAFDRLRELAASRTRGGAGALRDRMAASWTDIEILRLLNLRTVTRMAEGEAPGPETSVTKLHWAHLSQRLTDLALDVRGAVSWTAGEDPSGEWWTTRHLWSRAATIAGGTDEIQRTIVAERVLGMPR